MNMRKLLGYRYVHYLECSIVVIISWVCVYIYKTYQIVYCKVIQFIVCQLYLNKAYKHTSKHIYTYLTKLLKLRQNQIL